MLRQIEWRWQKEPITRSFSSNYFFFFFWNFCFRLRIPCRELICCTSHPSIYIHTSRNTEQKVKTSIQDFFSKCDQIQFPADLVRFTKEINNGKLHFLCSVSVGVLFDGAFSLWVFLRTMTSKFLNWDSFILLNLKLEKSTQKSSTERCYSCF